MLLWDMEVYLETSSSLVVQPFDHALFEYVEYIEYIANRIFKVLTSCGAINIAAN